MNAAQRYKVRIDYEDKDGFLHRAWNAGKFAKLPRLYVYIDAARYKLTTKGFRIIAYEIWDTYRNMCIESKTFS